MCNMGRQKDEWTYMRHYWCSWRAMKCICNSSSHNIVLQFSYTLILAIILVQVFHAKTSQTQITRLKNFPYKHFQYDRIKIFSMIIYKDHFLKNTSLLQFLILENLLCVRRIASPIINKIHEQCLILWHNSLIENVEMATHDVVVLVIPLNRIQGLKRTKLRWK